jgi:NhaP-type Na+/H+ or K+/H+ antiporter
MFIITPTISYLVAETLSCSGLNTLICLGIFQSIYTKQNLDPWQNKIVEQAIMFVAYFNRQMGAILIGIILPFYVELIDFSILKVVIFVVCVPLIQMSITYFLQNVLMDKLNSQSLFSQNEKTAMLLSNFSSSGVLTFTCAYATRNQYVITFVLLYVSMSIVVNLTISVYLIKYKCYLNPDNNKQIKFEITEEEIQFQNSENITHSSGGLVSCFGKLKSFIIDLHLDKIEPMLVR